MKPIPSDSSAWALECLLIFGTVSAGIGTFLALALGGGGFPLELLDGTPFRTPTLPGIILGVGIGGTQSLAAIALMRRARPALLYAAVAGNGMLIWIFTEVAMLEGFQWLQAFYFGIGLIEIILVLALLGIRPSVAASSPSAGPGTSDPLNGDPRGCRPRLETSNVRDIYERGSR
ncbi:MAG: hypothetical protein JWP31_389 [Aeromicrobium sp.]|nr:hypothetical protein [Aeromicrobium sp.]